MLAFLIWLWDLVVVAPECRRHSKVETHKQQEHENLQMGHGSLGVTLSLSLAYQAKQTHLIVLDSFLVPQSLLHHSS